MQAFEFRSFVEEDGVIRIPEEYRDRIHSSVKVIVLTENPSEAAGIPDFSALRIPTKGYAFDREEANER